MASRSKSRNAPAGASPFAVEAARLPEEKFSDPDWTAKGEPRASVPLVQLDTLWLNTGTLCNLACASCYIESSPTNDALVYLSHAHAAPFLDEAGAIGTPEIGFTGGEPFMNPDFVPMLADTLERGFEALILSNAMKPMRRHEAALLDMRERFGDRLTIRVSLDHHTKAVHEAERGPRSWEVAIDGLQWLSRNGFSLAVAGRMLPDESEADERAGYARLFAEHDIAVDAGDPMRLVLFPEMDEDKDIAEITTACWQILGQDPKDIMCATSRMVVHRKGEPEPRVTACTLIPYDPGFDMGATLDEASRPVKLNHPHCARFCVLGGASCSA
ncbi:radical SAM protein [Erythrobacter litoralis]|uniref:Radical SAM domain protein n=1 Tax=Erythrobacter litoralis (strain HTCC2594) TaxID=314225 RepID=Q2NDT0_ERYLH|nr:radical SAM protein [Erythrobacter litoralis]ABC62161.1 radical SAM domain protein [Erythrobacter litoralis HTCC2594]